MESNVQNDKVSSSTPPPHVEQQLGTTVDDTANIQGQEVSSTSSSDVKAILLSLVGFDYVFISLPLENGYTLSS
jgi:hypothetical protein